MKTLSKLLAVGLAGVLLSGAVPVAAKQLGEAAVATLARTGRPTAAGPAAVFGARGGGDRSPSTPVAGAAEAPAEAFDLAPQSASLRPALLGSVAASLGLTALFGGLGLGPEASGWMSGGVLVLLLASLFWLIWRLLRRWLPGGGGRFAFPAPAAGRQRPSRSSFASSQYEAAALAPESSVHYGAGGIDEIASRTGEFRWGVPAGFDATGFLQSAKSNFVLLQEAWDRADLGALRALMTDEMLVHIRLQLQERGDQPNRTDVVTLQAELLGVEDIGATFLANVEFSGMIREEITSGAAPFREVWCLTKPKDGSSGWLLAGVQALQ
ncbi:Tim44 domain-containing protein [Eleftheria terrae]|uniref:Tim44 domain-containing protein n=1 Tax=Eleftheria terrae TaxID=1597781 RepID=UPI00263B5335|nr:Tim44-like domain-containing protein [Eleftheria terrae]WKB52143.1 Tim44-like domain-containing protein [Eleftheria terrae]